MAYEPNDAKAIFLRALDLPTPADRAAFLDDACRDQPDLRGRVDQLLHSHDHPGSFLQQPAFDELAAATQDDGLPNRANAAGPKAGGAEPPLPLDFLQPCSTPERLGKLGVYEIIEVIGQGGMGVVLKAYDTKLHRIVAIKALAPTLAFNSTAAQRFLREARAAAAVSHDHVVTIFAIEESSVPPYLVMECIAGQSLQQKIDRRGALETAEILRIGLQIAEGLAAAHKQGLIHRDIKPANILLENGVERVKITDFGLARAADDASMTQTGHVAGTPQYMSPEQAKGERLDARSDLFSLGSVLYTMCTGRPAFRADSTVAVLRRVCDDTPRPISDINPDIPAWLIALIDKLLAKRPEDRFQSAVEVSESLSAYLAWSQQPLGSPAPSLPVVPSQRKGHGLTIMTVFVLLFGVLLPIGLVGLVVISTFFGYARLRKQPQPAGDIAVSEFEPSDLPLSPSVPNLPPLAVAPFDERQARNYQDVWADHLGVPVEFADPLGIDFRLIPPGQFQMGSAPEEVNALVRELEFNKASEFDKFVARSSAPRHDVRITRPYYLASHEVTVEQFQKFVDDTGYRSTLEAVKSPPFTWKSLAQGDDAPRRPVYGVSWEDAKAFCRWLSHRHQLPYELPTEAQWEFGCRAGSTTKWSFGDDAVPLPDYAVCEQDAATRPAAIGSKRPNAFGLHDMHGNVEEWCLDWHKTDYYGRSPTDDPVCLESSTDPASGRVSRGGAWNREAWRTRSSSRSYDFPGLPVYSCGFRVAIIGDLKATLEKTTPAAKNAE